VVEIPIELYIDLMDGKSEVLKFLSARDKVIFRIADEVTR
jgi:hypothetical protein